MADARNIHRSPRHDAPLPHVEASDRVDTPQGTGLALLVTSLDGVVRVQLDGSAKREVNILLRDVRKIPTAKISAYGLTLSVSADWSGDATISAEEGTVELLEGNKVALHVHGLCLAALLTRIDFAQGQQADEEAPSVLPYASLEKGKIAPHVIIDGKANRPGSGREGTLTGEELQVALAYAKGREDAIEEACGFLTSAECLFALSFYKRHRTAEIIRAHEKQARRSPPLTAETADDAQFPGNKP